MKKEEFLHKLDRRLDSVTIEDKMKTLEYYSEAIDDRIEDGLTEEEAVADLGSLDSIINDVINSLNKSEYRDENEFNPRVEVVENYNNRENNNYNNNSNNYNNNSKNDSSGVTILLLILLFPLWMTLFGLLFGLFVALWAIIFALAAGSVACIGAGIVGVFGGIGVMIAGSLSAGALAFSGSLMAVGVGLIILALLKYAIEGAIKITKKMYFSIKSCLGRCF